MLYQLSHVRMPVRGDLGPVRRISPALRQNFIRSSRNHQLEAGVAGKNLSPERTRVTLSPPLSPVRAARDGNQPPVRNDYQRYWRGRATLHASSRRGPGHHKSPRRGRKRIGRLRLRSHGGAAEGLRFGGVSRPVTGARAGKLAVRLPRVHCALRSSSASSVSTLTKSVSSPAGTMA